MPTLQQASVPLDEMLYERVSSPQIKTVLPVGINHSPSFNPFLRCPLPKVGGQPDNLRQFYRDGLIPQSRILQRVNL